MSDAAGQVLRCHPDTPAVAVRSVTAGAWRSGADGLEIGFTIEGDVRRLRVPEPRPPRRAHGLWQRTCCEAFLRRPGAEAYHEINLAPSGEWAAYAFERYRHGRSSVEESLAPAISVRRESDRLALAARVPLVRLSALYLQQPLCLALTTVVEEDDGRLSYWSLRHPPGAADFHHPLSFLLRV
ncbi:DOMON-like domain-containing protein [Candidatus Binatia bacterium]|nr:DOMON-like domain-containing protein [Candidatus Binatia bacterium]